MTRCRGYESKGDCCIDHLKTAISPALNPPPPKNGQWNPSTPKHPRLGIPSLCLPVWSLGAKARKLQKL